MADLYFKVLIWLEVRVPLFPVQLQCSSSQTQLGPPTKTSPLLQAHFLVDGQRCSGSLFDFGIYFYHCCRLVRTSTRDDMDRVQVRGVGCAARRKLCVGQRSVSGDRIGTEREFHTAEQQLRNQAETWFAVVMGWQ